MTADAVGHAFSVAVITPYCGEPLEVLARCHASVRGQAVHYMVADGRPSREIDDWDVEHIKLPRAHCDYGDTPRAIGAISAVSRGADAIIFLDADNWLEPTHVQVMTEIHKRTGAAVVTGARTLFAVDGERLGVCRESDGVNFNDTNCYFLTREAFPAIAAWVLKDRRESAIGDRVFWDFIVQGGYARSHSPLPTINYTTNLAIHYLMFGRPAPEGAEVIAKRPGDQFFGRYRYEDYLGWRQ
jgi:hypothetical protein